MKILLTGATGYIGKRLLPVLIKNGHHVYCCVRDKDRFDSSHYKESSITLLQLDFHKPETFKLIPEYIDAAYYLIHSMAGSMESFLELEKSAAENFRYSMEKTKVQQVIFLSGIINTKELSKHLLARKTVEELLSSKHYHLTTLRAGIIVGSGSASFEIIRDLVEKLPLMIAPRWLNTRSQPIAIRNVIEFLHGVLLNKYCYNKNFDIGGPDILTYKQMLMTYANERGLKRHIAVVPLMTPKLSSYWLYFITSTNYKLAVNLVDSMKVEVVCRANNLAKILNIKLLGYQEAIKLAFNKIEQQDILSSWIDAQSSNALDVGISSLLEVPTHGCFTDKRSKKIIDETKTLDKIWSIGGEHGWYHADWLWKLRGIIDKLFGGVGLRRGRKNQTIINAGDALDFWRVLYANKNEKRLLLYAEMKLPGEAWLEFKINGNQLIQTATYRPLGLWGRIYWLFVYPFHEIIFRGLINKLIY